MGFSKTSFQLLSAISSFFFFLNNYWSFSGTHDFYVLDAGNNFMRAPIEQQVISFRAFSTISYTYWGVEMFLKSIMWQSGRVPTQGAFTLENMEDVRPPGRTAGHHGYLC